MVLLVLLSIFLVILGLWIYIRHQHGILEEMGVPVIKSHPILGSARDNYEIPGGLLDIGWRKKYGPIFGVYEGRQPQLFICDPELVRLICVKDANCFDSKRLLEFGDPVLNEMPDFQPLEKWRILRGFATPAFTSAKLKMMNVPMREATMDFIDSITEKIRASKTGKLENYPVDTSIHAMLTDLISRCVFSIKINSNDGNNEFAKIVQEMMVPSSESSSTELLIWAHAFPILKRFMSSTFQAGPVKRFVKLFEEMMDRRRRTGEKHNDVVDMCMEWYDKLDSPEFKAAKVTELSILCQALVFFFAAQDQISTLVSTVIYHMALDDKLREKVCDEVDTAFEKHNGKLDRNQVSELTFINACISESLRMYPFFHRTERVCTKDWSNEKYRLNIKPGMVIQIPIAAINRDPETVENPDSYDPERFMPDNKHKLNPYSSTSFGHGPRNCTGKMFSLDVMPLILAHLVHDLEFVARENTELEFIAGGPVFQSHKPIFFDVVERKH